MPLNSVSKDSDAVTPYRKLHVLFDTSQNVLLQQTVSFERIGRMMSRSHANQNTSVQYLPGIGWRLRSYARGNTFLYERTDGQDNWLTVAGGQLTVASGCVTASRNRKITNTEITGIDTGSSSSLASTAAPMIRRQWADGDDVSTLNLSTAAFNQPDTADPSYMMDRIAETTAQYTYERDFLFDIDIPGTRFPSPDAVTTIYFPGLASETGSQVSGTYKTGRGEYAIKLYGDGKATMFERLTTGSPYTWEPRTHFQWATPGNIFGRHHVIYISQSASVTDGSGPGGVISIQCGDWTTATRTENIGINNLIRAVQIATDPDSNQSTVYQVQRASNTPIASHACNLRQDFRRDLRGIEFGFAVGKFLTTGTLTCDKFKLSNLSTRLASGVAPLHLDWDCDIPSVGSGGTGAALDLKLYSSLTGAELPSPTVVSSTQKTYPVPAAIGSAPYITEYFYIVATFTSASNQTLSPTLRSYKVYRDAVYDGTGTTEFEFTTDSSGGITAVTKAISRLSITGAERDISHESATISGADITGSYTTLGIRSGMPCSAWTSYDPADATKKWWLFDGYVTPSDTTPIPGTGSNSAGGFANKVLPTSTSYMLDLQVSGKWKRLQELPLTLIQQLFLHPDGSLWKVTEMVEYILGWCGFAPTEIAITPSPILLYGKGGSQYFGLELFANSLDVIQSILNDYLGQFIVWDRNIGANGMWRNLSQVRGPTYTNVAAFITKGPPQNDGSIRTVSNVFSYPLASTLGDGKTYTATAPTIYIDKGTLKHRVIEPEGNFLYVSCISAGGSMGVDSLMTMQIPNKLSYNFNPDVPTADPTHRDYLGRCKPIFYIIPSLTAAGEGTGYALTRIARRIFDISCHAVDQLSFGAPLKEIKNDYDATKVRSLRHYDPVTVDGVQYIVRDCNIDIEKDWNQQMFLEVEKPNF